MVKTILGIVAGILVWVGLVVVGGAILRATWPAYVAIEDSIAYTLPMLFTRLGIGAIALLVAASIAAMIAPKANLAALILGVVLVIFFVPVHINLWNSFPLWYHLTFLFTLVPLSLLGGQIHFKKTA